MALSKPYKETEAYSVNQCGTLTPPMLELETWSTDKKVLRGWPTLDNSVSGIVVVLTLIKLELGPNSTPKLAHK